MNWLLCPFIVFSFFYPCMHAIRRLKQKQNDKKTNQQEKKKRMASDE